MSAQKKKEGGKESPKGYTLAGCGVETMTLESTSQRSCKEMLESRKYKKNKGTLFVSLAARE